MKYLDEKNMLKSIYQHMKSEVSRCNKLEEVVSIMSKEAGHFALIAEYNKKVGDQLKAEVEEKNSKILELRTSVEKLNELQIQNTKEKLSLCYELSEVCSLQKQTDCILNQEIQKYKELDHKKKELVETASSTIQKYEEKQKNERIALKILLKDVKSLFEEKNTLMMQNSNFVKENEDLKYSLTKVTNENESLQMEIKNISSELQSKTNHLLEHESQIRQLTDKANYELEKSETKIVHFESTLRQLEEEKSGLQESIKYLQNNLQKVQKDLDESRTKEQNLRNNFNKTVEEKNRLEMLVKTETEKMIRDREEMKREIEYLNQVCDNVLKEFEANIISTEEKEEMFKKELDESKSLIIESSMELEKLVKHVSSKDATIQKLTVASQKFTSNLKRIERDYKELERKHRHTMNEFQSLNVVLNSLRQDMGILNANHRAALEHIANLEQEKVLSAKELEDDKLLYKKHVEELARKCEEYEEDTASLQSEIADLRNKLENEKSAYSTLACLHKEISAKFMKIVKDMITIKNAKQEALSRANKLGEELAKIKSEKNLLEDKVLTIQNDVKHYENLYKQCLEKRMTLEKEITASHLQGPEEHEATLANCQKHQKMVESLQKDLKDSYDTIDELKLTVYDYKRQITDLELKRSEMNLKLHETQRRLNTEQALVEQLRNTHKLILAAVLEMKERGRVDSNDGGLLLSMVQSSANTTASDESIQRACLSDPTIEPVTNDK